MTRQTVWDSPNRVPLGTRRQSSASLGKSRAAESMKREEEPIGHVSPLFSLRYFFQSTSSFPLPRKFFCVTNSDCFFGFRNRMSRWKKKKGGRGREKKCSCFRFSRPNGEKSFSLPVAYFGGPHPRRTSSSAEDDSLY